MAAIFLPPVKPPQWARSGWTNGDGAGLGDFGEFARREQPLAGRERAVDPAGQIGHRRRVAGLDRFFNEQRPDRRDDVDIGLGGVNVNRAGRGNRS